MSYEIINTSQAPKAIGSYSQATKVGDLVFLSGQIPLVPETMTLNTGDLASQIRQIFQNLRAVAQAAGGDLANIVKLTVYLTDMENYPLLNEIMGEFFQQPYPARALVGVASLPKGVPVEVEGILVLPN
jgi:reactive intermediate/imine deaminase